MRLRLLRENDDPKLLSDLERLAGREPAPVVDDAAVEGDGVGEEVEESPLDDPFVRRFVQVSVHLKRYGPFYAGAALWALVMLLIQPVGGGGSSDVPAGPGFAGTASVEVATASADSAVADFNADAIGAPVFETVTGAAAFSEADSAFGDFSDSEFSSAPSDTGTSSSTPPGSSGGTITFDDSVFGSEEEEVAKGFVLVRSGYASSTGGTPLEQDPPGGALPVAVSLGNDTKRSFIEISGTGPMLRLKESPTGAVNPTAAVIKACLATSPWEAKRGQALASGPTFDTACTTGSRAEGVWTFDLAAVPTEDLKRGLVLTAGPGTGHTFEVRLEPMPLPDDA